MPNIQAIKSSVPVALLYQTSERGGHLKDALHELGAAIVYESLAMNFDRVALEGSGARVVVFNLDADSESQIDHVYDVLDAGNYEVVFNEDDVSSNLSGWDQARWARNLAAKILRKPEIAVPPRPHGAESVPTPVQKSVAVVPVAERPGETLAEPAWAPLAGFETPVPVAPEAALPEAEAASAELSELPGDLDAALQASEAPTLQLPILDLGEPIEGQPVVAPEHEFPIADFGSALDEFVRQAPAPAQQDDAQNFTRELDALFGDTRAGPAAVSRDEAPTDESADIVQANLASDEITWTQDKPEETDSDFPAIFDQFDAAAADIPEAKDRAFKPAPLGRPLREPVTDDTKSTRSESGEAASTPTGPLIPSEWLLEPIDENAPGTPPPAKTGKATFGIKTVTASEFLAPQVEPSAREPSIQASAVGAASLELMPMEDAVAPQAYAEGQHQGESWLDGSRPVAKLKVGTGVGVQRVFVLGASIGGPEAVRDFLATLPAGFPVLFVLVQHMGEEFLELMSAQLAKAVVLTVRNPSHGEHVGHGEIVVVPTTHRLQIDSEGVITLAHLPERAAYSPSIDLVMRDVADQFGEKAGAIVFSGMAQDAIEGSKYLKSMGGVIWAQDPDTCAISTMVDGVKQTGVVSFIGSPQELAAKMIADYGKNQG